jgi:four helix bundle suffix protein
LEDYRDFLRTHGIAEWEKNHPYARRLSELLRTTDATYETFKKAVEHDDPAVSANAILGLTKVAYALLTNQIKQLEVAFVEEGGLRERMTRARLHERDRQREKLRRGDDELKS